MLGVTVSQTVLFVAAWCSAAVAVISHSHETPVSDGLTVASVGVCLSMVTYLVFPSALSETPPPFLAAVSMTAGTLIVGGWFALAARYSESEFLTSGVRIPVLVSPLVGITTLHWLASLDPGVHSALQTAGMGSLRTAFDAYAYALVGISVLLLVGHLYRVERAYRRQTAILVVAPLAPWITAEIYKFDAVPITADLAPVGYIPTLFLTLYALCYQDLLDIAPIARETMINSIEDTVISVTADGVVASVNDPGKELLGLGDDVVGEDLSDALADWPSILDAVTAREDRQISIDGRAMRVAVTPIEKRDARYGFVVHLRDVTYEVQRREALRRKQEELERTNDQLDEFASVVSHDIRNPLNVAQGHLELIAEDVENDDSVEAMRPTSASRTSSTRC